MVESQGFQAAGVTALSDELLDRYCDYSQDSRLAGVAYELRDSRAEISQLRRERNALLQQVHEFRRKCDPKEEHVLVSHEELRYPE